MFKSFNTFIFGKVGQSLGMPENGDNACHAQISLLLLGKVSSKT